MTLVIPPGHAQASIEFLSDYDPDPWYTTFGVQLVDAEGDFTYMANFAASAFETGFQAILSNEVMITACELRVGQDGGPPLLVRVNRGNRGGSSADMLPQNCAALIRKGTNRAGRTGRGRMYLPGVLPENKVSQTGIIASDHLGVLEGAAEAFLEALDDPIAPPSPTSPMVLLHNAFVPGGTTPDPVVSLIPDNRIATQRRRLR